MKWFLFAANNSTDECGAWAFHSSHDDKSDAKLAGLQWATDLIAQEKLRLSHWMHLAEYNGHTIKVIAILIIPGTEYSERTDVLEWMICQ